MPKGKRSRTSRKTSANISFSSKPKSGKSKKKSKKIVKKRMFRVLIVFFVMVSGFMVVDRTMQYLEERELLRASMTGEDFINRLEPVAIREYRRSGILPSITIGQAILESNWGKSKLTVDANNLFGIKAGSGWNGDVAKFRTKEHYDQYIYADFRKYNSWEESVVDHTEFLIRNKRYKRYGLFSATSYRSQAQALENAGYATSKNKNGELIYADLLIDVIEKNHLNDIDNKVMKVE